MKKINYKGQSVKDLVKTLGEKRESLRKLRFGTSGSKTRNVKENSSLRKEIARVMTELSSIRRGTSVQK